MTEYDPFYDIEAWRKAAHLLYMELHRVGMPLMCECHKSALPEYTAWLDNPKRDAESIPTPRFTEICRRCRAIAAYTRVGQNDDENERLDRIEIEVFGEIRTRIAEPVDPDSY